LRIDQDIGPMSIRKTAQPWVIVAGGFHRRGGMDKANLALAEHLLERNTPTHLVTHDAEPHLQNHPLATVHMVARPRNSFLLGEFALAVRGKRVARQVVSQWPQACVVVNGGNCIWAGVNWVHYIHHAWSGPKQGGWKYWLKGAVSQQWAKRSERAALRRARLVITNSKRTSREVVEYFGVPETLVHTVYLGRDTTWGPVTPDERQQSRQWLQINESRPVAVFVGGLGYDHRKGFDVLFSAWKQLCARAAWDANLLVAGGGPALEMWRAHIREAGLERRIRLLGFCGDVKRVLAAADLLISPVRYEAYGLNVQEAICRGVPAMVSASAGVAEQYESGFAPMLISDPENANELAERLLEWRPEKDQWQKRFEKFSARLRARTWRDTALDFIAIVDETSREQSALKVPAPTAVL